MRQNLKVIILLFSLGFNILFAKSFKVGYVNFKYILDNYESAQLAKRSLDLEVLRYKAVLDSLKRIVEELKTTLESQKLILSDEALRAKELELVEAQMRYEKYIEEIWGESGAFKKKNQELLAPIMTEIKMVLKDLAQKEGYTLIFDSSEMPIIYADDEFDLTEKVLLELNRKAGVALKTSPPKDSLPPIKKDLKMVVLPIYDENQTSQLEHIGEEIRNLILDILKSFSRINLTSKAEVNNALLSRNINLSSDISEIDALSLGLLFGADYVILGKNRKEGNSIDVTIKVFEVASQKKIFEDQKTVARKDALKAALGEVLQKFLKTHEIKK
jgi:outer membrane protein